MTTHRGPGKVSKLVHFLSEQLHLRLAPAPVPDQLTPIEIQAEFIAQEHRTLFLIRNLLGHYYLPTGDPRRSAAVTAFLSRLLLSNGATAASAVTAGVVVSMATVYLALKANDIAEQQTNLLSAQSRIQEEQGRMQLAIADNSVNAPYGPDIVQMAGLMCDDPIDEKTVRKGCVLSRVLSPHVEPGPRGFGPGGSLESLFKGRQYSPEKGVLLYGCAKKRGEKVAGSSAYKSFMKEVDFSQSIQDGMDMRNLALANANLDKSSFWNSDLSGADFSDSSLFRVEFINAESYTNSKGDLRVEELRTSFRHVEGEQVLFSSSYLQHVDFNGANLRNATFDYSNLLVDVDFEKAELHGASFKNCFRIENVKFHRAFLPAAEAFKDSEIVSMDLDGAFTADENWLRKLKKAVTTESAIGEWNIRKLNKDDHQAGMMEGEDWYVIEK